MKIKNYLSESPLYSLYLSSSHIIDDFQRLLKKQKLHFLQGLLLTALFFEDRDIRPAELIQAFQIDPSTLSHALRGLEKKGLIKRSQHPHDARGYLFSLTPNGIKRSLEIIKLFEQSQQYFEEQIGIKKIKSFITILEEFRNSYSAFKITRHD